MANVRLTEEIETRLEALSKTRDRTPHYLMKLAIERFLDVEEAIESERKLVLERWKEYELTGEAISSNDMDAWAEELIAKEEKSRA